MPGSEEEIIRIEVDSSQLSPAIEKVKKLDDMVQKASKNAKGGFIDMGKNVTKTNEALKKNNVFLDKMFSKIKLARLSGSVFSVGGQMLGATSAESAVSSLGSMAGSMAGFMGALSTALTAAIVKGMSVATGSIATTLGAERAGTTAEAAAGLKYTEKQMGLPQGALLNTAYSLNQSLKDVSNAGAFMLLTGGKLNQQALSQMDTSTATMQMLDAIRKNPMARNPYMRKRMMSAASSLGINESVMIDAIDSQQRSSETLKYFGTEYAREKAAGIDYGKTKTWGRNIFALEQTVGRIGKQIEGGISKITEEGPSGIANPEAVAKGKQGGGTSVNINTMHIHTNGSVDSTNLQRITNTVVKQSTVGAH